MTVATCVCWSIASLTSTWYGSGAARPLAAWARQGRSRRWRSYQARSRRANELGAPNIRRILQRGRAAGAGVRTGFDETARRAQAFVDFARKTKKSANSVAGV